MEEKKKFVIEQLDEALEERQRPDRRKKNQGFTGNGQEERRKYNRRGANQSAKK